MNVHTILNSPVDEPLQRIFSHSSLSSSQIEEVKALLTPLLWALSTTRRTMPHISFGEAVRASLKARIHRRYKTRLELKSYTSRMLRYKDIAERPIQQLNIADCNEMMDNVFCSSPHVRRKAQSVLHSIFAYAARHGWCDHNPAEGIDLVPPQEKTIHPLTITQIKKLLRVCQKPRFKEMEPAVRLMLWCGIRPAEVQRLRWGDIDPKEKLVYVDPQHSKTGGARAIPLRGGAIRLIRNPGTPGERIVPKNWNNRWKEVRRAAGFRTWQQDALRHSFASYHLKYFHNLLLLQEEMGHRDNNLLRTRYLNHRYLTSLSAKQFFLFSD